MAKARSLPGRLGSAARFRPSDFKPLWGLERGLTDPSCGSSCSKCDPASVEIYEWIGEGSTDKIRVIQQPPGNC